MSRLQCLFGSKPFQLCWINSSEKGLGAGDTFLLRTSHFYYETAFGLKNGYERPFSLTLSEVPLAERVVKKSFRTGFYAPIHIIFPPPAALERTAEGDGGRTVLIVYNASGVVYILQRVQLQFQVAQRSWVLELVM